VNRQRPDNDNKPEAKPPGPRTPYPVDYPGISRQPGNEPDDLPGKSPESLPKM
jgi:hypothetical protein